MPRHGRALRAMFALLLRIIRRSLKGRRGDAFHRGTPSTISGRRRHDRVELGMRNPSKPPNAAGALVAGIVLALIVEVVAGYIAVRAGMIPANADARPSRIEPGWRRRRCARRSNAKRLQAIIRSRRPPGISSPA